MEANIEMLKIVKRKKWIYCLRQLLVCSGVWALCFVVGNLLGAPTVYIPQLRREADSAEVLSDEMASWLYSTFGFAAVPWLVLLPAIVRLYGPRKPYIAACVNILIANIIFYFSTSITQILISQVIFAFSYANALTIGIIIVSEYVCPKYRGIFLTIKATSMVWGIWCSNAIGTFFHWKCIAYPGFLSSAYTFTFVFWPESPQWLASRGRFEECRKAFYWLQGRDEQSEIELEKLISSQVNAQKSEIHRNDWSSISNAIRTVRCKEFYGPLLLAALLNTQCNFTGKIVCTVYSIDILKKMTGDESTAYMGMLILDGVTVFTMYFGCYLSKHLNRRTLFFVSSFIGISCLFMISLYLYLVNLSVIEESTSLSIVMLTIFSIAIGCGPMIMNMSIYAEIIPLRFKCVMVLIGGLIFYLSLTVLLKITPFIFKNLGVHGAFLFYGIASGTCTVLLYKYLPETKDKTLQEIEENFKERYSETERLK